MILKKIGQHFNEMMAVAVKNKINVRWSRFLIIRQNVNMATNAILYSGFELCRTTTDQSPIKPVHSTLLKWTHTCTPARTHTSHQFAVLSPLSGRLEAGRHFIRSCLSKQLHLYNK